ncbi:hypothetical protein E2C01_036406 [Portunus trituberculatus]|uniref:Uncharacterized protein n=1 Tax=Portunus trituberculatus TaxID=210409 RepID=A0A5B7FE38_PORTR|nr:hypothetical protein [Portunus trituberculatus]
MATVLTSSVPGRIFTTSFFVYDWTISFRSGRLYTESSPF